MMIRVHPRVRGLIFDCDGTLADTVPIHMQAWCEAFEAVGENCPRDFVLDLRGMPAEEIVNRFNRHFGRRVDARTIAADKNRRARRNLVKSYPIEPVANIVRKFRGKLPMAVASGGNRDNVLLILEAIGLKNHFDAVVTADDGVRPKPAPDIFLAAARLLSVRPERCQVFEDGNLGLEAARKAGMVATDVRPWTQG